MKEHDHKSYEGTKNIYNISRAENKLKQLWQVINIKVKKAKLWEIQSGFSAITADENDFLYCLVIS